MGSPNYPKYKQRVTAIVHKAVKDGVLIRPASCPKCGRQGDMEAHHPDYSKPLDVVWLCKPCHSELHRGTTFDSPIRHLRKRLRLTTRELASMIGIEQPALVLWETGKTAPNAKHAAKLAEIARGEYSGPVPKVEHPIRAAREARGLKQIDVARWLGMHQNVSVSCWERGIAPIPKKHHAALSRLLAIPADELR